MFQTCNFYHMHSTQIKAGGKKANTLFKGKGHLRGARKDDNNGEGMMA